MSRRRILVVGAATVALFVGAVSGGVALTRAGEPAAADAAALAAAEGTATFTNVNTVTYPLPPPVTVTVTETTPPTTTEPPPTTTTEPPPPPPPPPSGKVAPGQSWQTAYNDAPAGGTISVLAGNHGTPALAAGAKVVTFLGQDGAVVSSMPGGTSNLTFQHIIVNTGQTHGDSNASHITAPDITWLDVDVTGPYASVQTYNGAANFKWLGGSLKAEGARSCQAGDGEPLWLGANAPTIDHIAFGKLVSGSCNNADGRFHGETVRVQGVNDVAITNSTFTQDSDSGSGHIFITHYQPSSSVAKRFRAEGNTFPRLIGSYAIQVHSNVQTYDHWIFRNNSWAQGILDPGSYAALVACGNTGAVAASWKAACP